MAKSKTVFTCQSCSFQSPKWLGQCPECGEWNTFVEDVTVVQPKYSKSTYLSSQKQISPVTLTKIKPNLILREPTTIEEFDRVLGGGLVPGQVILLTGAPGVGKSTLLTQLCSVLSNKRILYICGEESPSQIKLRADRLGLKGEFLELIDEKDINNICAYVEKLPDVTKPFMIIVDSIQSLYSSDLPGLSGGASQLRDATEKLINLAKSNHIPTIIVGHITKEGTIAGPKILEHMVDTVLSLESDTNNIYRIIRSTKNRFGPVSEVGIFEMTTKGMIEVANPSAVFLNEESLKVPGSCMTVVMEGQRPLIFEIQSITNKTFFGYPKRTASGFSITRLQVLVAVLEKRANLSLSEQDIYLNVSGGYKVSEHSADLAVCLAIASSFKDKTIKPDTIAIGEVGLSGEIRNVSFLEQRIKEAKKLGYKNIISPQNCKNISDAMKLSLA